MTQPADYLIIDAQLCTMQGAGGGYIADGAVAGRTLVQDGAVLTADEEAIRNEAQTQAQRVAAAVAADPLHQEMALLAAMGWGEL